MNGILNFYFLAISICEAAIEASDCTTDFERRAIAAMRNDIIPRLKATAVMMTEGSGNATVDVAIACADLSTACNTVISALNGSTQEERNVISNAKGMISTLQSQLRQQGVPITIPIGRYGEPIPQVISSASVPSRTSSSSSGCYIATAAYGSYDCPQVWVLRRYRDETLAKSNIGRAFIRAYYAISPKFVSVFGKVNAVNRFNRGVLNRLVSCLLRKGYSDQPYQDR
ncbi:CFI-box-CTERM domain-containing protein [Adlercreutzia murintestinalis]|jgi:hypothetical protein|uniref:CFI-box-CTERM domain-containing protein n=1 Tax=Adlercreutzia murintestinalis TaxID=2941325 RepID=UPI00203EDD4A|nr:CFI-box-CTERM domain-containing protein [Adlercreutzia murintestinalis]